MQSIKELFGRQYRPEKGICFVLMPFRPKLNEIYQRVIKPTIESLDERFSCVRADEIYSTKPIVGDIWEYIQKAEVIVADLTGRNPNVLYELGLCHALWKKVILLAQRLDDIPFDLKHFRVIIYEHTLEGADILSKELRQAIIALREADTLQVQATPGQGEREYTFADVLELLERLDESDDVIEEEQKFIDIRNKLLLREASDEYSYYILQIDVIKKLRLNLRHYGFGLSESDQDLRIAILWDRLLDDRPLIVDSILIANRRKESIRILRKKRTVDGLIADAVREILTDSKRDTVRKIKDKKIDLKIEPDDVLYDDRALDILTHDEYIYGVLQPPTSPILVTVKKPGGTT